MRQHSTNPSPTSLVPRGPNTLGRPDEASSTTGGTTARDQIRAAEPPPSRMDRLVSWMAARLLLRTVPRKVQGAVVLVMLCLVVAIEGIAAHTPRATFHPAPLLLAGVVFATLVGGLVAGLVCAVIAVAYELSFALTRGEDLRYALGSVIVLLFVAPATALAIGTLRAYAERAGQDRERLLQQQAQLLARELALQDTNRRMDVFVGMVTHELKSPLSSLKVTIQVAARQHIRRTSPPDVASDDRPGHAAQEQTVLDLLCRADRQVDRLTRLVDDLLDVTRAQTDKLVLRPEPCDLVELVQEVVADERAAWLSRSIAVEAAPHPIRVSVDRGRIAQVMTNYLTNALKYSPADAPVEVRVWAEEATARVAVHDAGPGLTEDEQLWVWERFHQVAGSQSHLGHQGQSKMSGGLGLGLFISRAIIQRHGGEVGVESAPGRGATFWFAVPAPVQEKA